MNKTFPFKRRGISFPIYWTPKGDYPGWTFRHPVSRKRISRAGRDDILEQANLAADQIEQGQTEQETLTALQASQYRQACILAEKCGTTLLGMASDYSEAFTILPHGVTLTTAARHWRATAETVTIVTVPVAKDQFLAHKEQDGISHAHLRNLKHVLKHFAADFPGPVSSVTAPKVDQWLRAKKSARTRKNYLGTLQNFLNWCKGQKYLPSTWNEVAQIAVPECRPDAPHVYAPAQFEAVLRQCQTHSKPELICYLVLRGMLGLRDAEAFRVKASQLRADALIVEGEQAKVRGRRRIVPLHGYSGDWLKLYAPKSGRIVPLNHTGTWQRTMRRMFANAKVPRLKNALRDSFISYRMAQTKNAAEVSDEAGNSPAKVHANYREIALPDGAVITKEMALEWFGITPDNSRQNLTQNSPS